MTVEWTFTKWADLTPPLGKPGGPCQVVQRIEDEVPDPRLRAELAEEVERGRDLTNPEAAQVYDLEVEPGVGLFRRLHIGPHAQYRMDLRKVTLDDVRVTLQRLQKQLNDWKSQKNWRYDRFVTEALTGKAADWEDPKTRLVVAFTVIGQGDIKLVTTFWKGVPDPRPPGRCEVRAYSQLPQDQAGASSVVTERSQKGLPEAGSGTENNWDERQKGDTTPERKEQALPVAPDHRKTRDVEQKTPKFNAPGESGSAPDEKSISKDKPRTKGKPGDEEDEHPYVDNATHGWVSRRPDVTAGIPPAPAYPQQHQKTQHGQAETYYRHEYRTDRSHKKTDAQKRYRRLKNNPAFQKDLERRREHPERFKRKPGGGYTRTEDRAEDEREEARMAQTVMLACRVMADFLYEKEPPSRHNAPDEMADRWAPHDPTPGLPQPGVPDNPGSAKVIPENRDFVNNSSSTRLAARIADIEEHCSPDLLKKSRPLWVKLKRVDAKNAIWHFAVEGSKAPYLVRMKAPPEGSTKDIQKVNVFVSCSCPFWRWQGPEHWAQRNDYLYREPQGEATPPVVKDPKEQHWACKHVLAVMRHVRDLEWQALAPRAKKASGLRYLADRLALGRVLSLEDGTAQMARTVASRYLKRSG